ncbi:MAG: metallophosphoesterase [bacterium]|nr:metallophosphoesterase [bacterium]
MKKIYLSGLVLFVLLPIFAAGLIITAYVDARYIEPNWIKVEKVRIKCPPLAGPLKDVRLVFIADLHVRGKIGYREKRLVKIVNDLRPDLILLGGDYIVEREDIEPSLEVLANLKAPQGVFGIMGDYERTLWPPQKFAQQLRRIGVVPLLDETKKIQIENRPPFYLLGLKVHCTAINDLERMMEGIPEGAPTLLLVHQPWVVEPASKMDIDLVLAGDIHGGQMGIAWIRQLTDDYSGLKYVSGLYQVGETLLYLTRGIGWTHKHIRFLCRPEVTLIKIVEEGWGEKPRPPEEFEGKNRLQTFALKWWGRFKDITGVHLIDGE